MCKYCFGDKQIETTTSFTVDKGERLIVVRHVPCIECPVCGEVLISEEVSERLEEILEKANKDSKEVFVIEYSAA